MKKILFLVLMVVFATAKSQDTCTADARVYTNTNIVQNGIRAITATKLNTALNKVIDAIECLDESIFISTDSSTVVNYDVLNSQNAPPVSPSTGDTYLVGTVPTGAWVGHAKDIAEWNGSAWVFTDGVQGDFLYNATTVLTYIFRSGSWVQTTGIPALNNGNTISSGLRIGTNNAKSLTFETNNANRGRFDSIGRFYVYNLPTATSADTFVNQTDINGKFTKIGKSTFLAGVSGGGSGAVDTFYSVRYGQIDTLMDNNQLNVGATYKINDRGDLGLFFKALSDSTIDNIGTRLMLCPAVYNTSVDAYGNSWIGTWTPIKSVSIDDLAVRGGLVWKNVTGNIGTAVSDFELDNTNWVLIPKTSFSNNEYIPLPFEIIFDFENDWIQEQHDEWGNFVGIATPLLINYQPCDVTDWNSAFGGGTIITGNPMARRGIFNNDVWLDSILQGFITSNLTSLIKNCYGQKKINLNRTSVEISNCYNTGDITNNTSYLIANFTDTVVHIMHNTVDYLDGSESPFDTLTGNIKYFNFNYNTAIDNEIKYLIGPDARGETKLVNIDSLPYIPMSGTVSGRPVAGDIEMSDYLKLLWKSSVDNTEAWLLSEEGNFSIILVDPVDGNSNFAFSKNGLDISEEGVSPRGITSPIDYSANITDLDYTQKIYVGFRGTATLSSGTVTVSTASVKTGYKIYVSVNTPSGTQGFLSAPTGSIVNETSFVINSTSVLDNSTVNWWIAP